MVLPITATLSGAEVVGGPARLELGQLDGRSAARFAGRHDGTPDRTLATWIVRGEAGAEAHVNVAHQRAGSVDVTVVLGS
jgi:hypothetical protein